MNGHSFRLGAATRVERRVVAKLRALNLSTDHSNGKPRVAELRSGVVEIGENLSGDVYLHIRGRRMEDWTPAEISAVAAAGSRKITKQLRFGQTGYSPSDNDIDGMWG